MLHVATNASSNRLTQRARGTPPQLLRFGSPRTDGRRDAPLAGRSERSEPWRSHLDERLSNLVQGLFTVRPYPSTILGYGATSSTSDDSGRSADTHSAPTGGRAPRGRTRIRTGSAPSNHALSRLDDSVDLDRGRARWVRLNGLKHEGG
ncbi:hypothetical protein AKJ09_09566 [Labilithrix luteola]|uniref:Uncharacterized protein n=1 Tax=Labilithrix luteola TaxID=1391654 RepID=A0A0K1QAZ2_9BACT|nr:hypothetical protein AKJ09_09566 [Labilithrix luteola]